LANPRHADREDAGEIGPDWGKAPRSCLRQDRSPNTT
jgi:hypothetical protein